MWNAASSLKFTTHPLPRQVFVGYIRVFVILQPSSDPEFQWNWDWNLTSGHDLCADRAQTLRWCCLLTSAAAAGTTPSECRTGRSTWRYPGDSWPMSRVKIQASSFLAMVTSQNVRASFNLLRRSKFTRSKVVLVCSPGGSWHWWIPRDLNFYFCCPPA